MRISLVVDSTTDLSRQFLAENNIEVVPLNIQFGEESFTDGIDINNTVFYQKMQESEILPKTASPSPQAFLEAFRRIGPNNPILCITISSAISGTYQSALIARDMLNYPIEIIDSLNISMGTGLQIIKAVELINKGLSLEKIKKEILGFRHTIKTFIAIDNLENVIKGGRISNWKGTVAQILNIKPVLNICPDGSIKVVENIRGKRRQLKKIFELINNTGKDISKTKFCILHAKVPLEELKFIENKIRELFNPREIIIGELGPVMGSHGGFGTVGFVF